VSVYIYVRKKTYLDYSSLGFRIAIAIATATVARPVSRHQRAVGFSCYHVVGCPRVIIPSPSTTQPTNNRGLSDCTCTRSIVTTVVRACTITYTVARRFASWTSCVCRDNPTVDAGSLNHRVFLLLYSSRWRSFNASRHSEHSVSPRRWWRRAAA